MGELIGNLEIYFNFQNRTIYIECLFSKRIDGDLAVSRAFGDFEYKKRSDLDAKYQKVSCHPDIRVIDRSAADDVLILACDGLWDVVTSVEAVEHVRNMFLSGENNLKLVAEELIDIALNKGKFV